MFTLYVHALYLWFHMLTNCSCVRLYALRLWFCRRYFKHDAALHWICTPSPTLR